MLSKKSAVPFRGTKEQEEELLKVIEELKDEKGALMPIMQRAQDIYGYLPIEVQKIISDQMGIPLEKIYGVATFYAQFNLIPKGRYQISVCLGTACYVKGSGDIYNKLMEKIEKRGMESEGMEQYLSVFKHGMPPHGGLGIGLERLTMKLVGEDNVRETTLFPRDLSRL